MKRLAKRISQLESLLADSKAISIVFYSVRPLLHAAVLECSRDTSITILSSQDDSDMQADYDVSQNLHESLSFRGIDHEYDSSLSLSGLRSLWLIYVAHLKTRELMKDSWTPAVEHAWKSALLSKDLTVQSFSALIQTFAENIRMNVFPRAWAIHQTKWFETAESVKSLMDVAQLMYSFELFVPRSVYRNPAGWDEYRLEWFHAVKRFPNEELLPIRDAIRITFNLSNDEEGHGTRGHRCITAQDKAIAESTGCALLFGEFLATGVHRAFDVEHLDASRADVIYDFGMGLGKLMMQAYMEYTNVTKFVGVELSPSRYIEGRDALRALVLYDDSYTKIQETDTTITIADPKGRTLEFREQNLFDCHDGLATADIIILETHFPKEIWPSICRYIAGMKPGSRVLTYENLHEAYGAIGDMGMPFEQQAINTRENDRFYTTWSPKRGHHFYTWTRR